MYRPESDDPYYSSEFERMDEENPLEPPIDPRYLNAEDGGEMSIEEFDAILAEVMA